MIVRLWCAKLMHHSRSECPVRYPCLNFYRANRCTIDFVRLLSRGYLPHGYLAVIRLWSDSYYYPGDSECIVEIFEVLFDKLETNIFAFTILLSVDMEAKQIKRGRAPNLALIKIQFFWTSQININLKSKIKTDRMS